MQRIATDFQIKSINDQDRSFWAVGSTEAVDRSGDIVRQSGWNLDSFKRNPVIPFAHDYKQPPVAQAVDIRVEGTRLLFKPKFPSPGVYPFADQIYGLYKEGVLRAFSVGFMPLDGKPRMENGRQVGMEYTKADLYEISAVVVPANQEALIAAQAKGLAVPAQLLTGKAVAVAGLSPARVAQLVGGIVERRITGAISGALRYHLGDPEACPKGPARVTLNRFRAGKGSSSGRAGGFHGR